MYPIFIYNQFITFLQATALVSLTLQTTTVIDVDSLYSDTWLAIIQDKILQKYLHHPMKYWLLGISGLENKKIYVLQKDDLCMHILQYYDDHILVNHFRQNNIRTHLLWLYLAIPIYIDVKKFCNYCITCIRFKLQHHKPYRILKQLLIFK